MKKTVKKRSFLVPAIIGALLAAAAIWFLLPHIKNHVDKTGYPMKYADVVLTEAEKRGVSPSLCFAVILVESGYNEKAVSPAGAKGLMQITDDTADWIAASLCEKRGDLFDPETNIKYGVWLLRKNLDDFGAVREALAAYNAGRSRVRGWLSDESLSDDGKTLAAIPYNETDKYVDAVVTAAAKYSELYDLD